MWQISASAFILIAMALISACCSGVAESTIWEMPPIVLLVTVALFLNNATVTSKTTPGSRVTHDSRESLSIQYGIPNPRIDKRTFSKHQQQLTHHRI